ncbi:hypothetical protein HK414_27845 [Ramlibacter terrae]|uniref:Dyp-type peroxidase n=1 Tax=Ramlibacter terrae TaxID=2732511 RepID=A0ABX6P6A1_9BURK|nr:hypothetical protein HK414_27845 [Ramlibacter terrae]
MLQVRPRTDRCIGSDDEPILGGGAARQALSAFLHEVPLTVGDDQGQRGLHCTLGFSYRGLEALGMTPAYLRVFSRLAPAFAEGAPLRAAQLGDSGGSAPAHWDYGFGIDHAHVIVTCHGACEALRLLVDKWGASWSPERKEAPLICVGIHEGHRLGAPDGQGGQWVHFGFRDGLVDHHIEGVQGTSRSHWWTALRMRPASSSSATRTTTRATRSRCRPRRARCASSSTTAASACCARWNRTSSVSSALSRTGARRRSRCCARPSRARGSRRSCADAGPMAGGAAGPVRAEGASRERRHAPALRPDAEGTGCPFSSHVRRMDPNGHAGARQRPRTLLRRGMPYGPANWDGTDDRAKPPRGLMGLFFCAGIDDQFEPLLGLWANGPPPGGAAGRLASDPFAGQNDDRKPRRSFRSARCPRCACAASIVDAHPRHRVRVAPHARGRAAHPRRQLPAARRGPVAVSGTGFAARGGAHARCRARTAAGGPLLRPRPQRWRGQRHRLPVGHRGTGA